MAAKPDLSPALGEEIRRSLGALAAVEAVLLDAVTGALWVVCRPETGAAEVEEEVRAALDQVGAPAELEPELLVRLEQVPQRRVRLTEVTRTSEPEGRSRITVSLDWEGRTHTGSAVGGAVEAMELRTAASAALEALSSVLARPVGARVVGAKTLRAFDVELVVVSVVRDDPNERYLVGAVPRTPVLIRAAAMALLQALNRVLARELAPAEL